MISYITTYLVPIVIVFSILLIIHGLFPKRLLSNMAKIFFSRNLFCVKNQRGDEIVINVARIVLGFILISRLFGIGEFLFPLNYTSEQAIYFWILVALSMFILIGFITPIASLILLLFQLRLNSPLSTYTLGVDVTAMLLTIFILYPAGRRLSIDSVLSKQSKKIDKLYSLFILNDRATQIALAKAVSFYSYTLLCLYSVLMHFKEDFWLSGEAAIEILSSTYLSRYPYVFQGFFSSSAWAVLIAKLAMQGMIIWYLVLFPFVLIGGIPRKLAIAWTILFLLTSTFVLQLSTLPYIEFLLLIIWFWGNVEKFFDRKFKNGVSVLYDDRCNLCDRTIRFLKFVDIFQNIKFLPISKNLNMASLVGVSPEDLYKDICSWSKCGQVYVGFDFYTHLTKNIPLLLPVFPFMLFLRWTKIGPYIYRVVADRRIKTFGVCKMPVDPEVVEISSLNNTGNHSEKFFFAFVSTVFLFSIFFTAFLPYSPVEQLRGYFKNQLISAHILGLPPINVFNLGDVGMSYQYFTVSDISTLPERLIPYTAKDGQRLTWHRSDKVYFGNSLKWRRLKNSQEILPPTERDIKFFCEIITWDNIGTVSLAKYRFDFFKLDRPTKEGGRYRFSNPLKISEIELRPEDCPS